MSGPATASLAMYDWPEVQAANDAMWAFIAARLRQAGIAATATLNRAVAYDATWLWPDLLLAQTCGYPFATALTGKVQLVGTPGYAVAGCDGANYSSVIVGSKRSHITAVRDLETAVAAINSANSQSGHWALRAALSADGGNGPKRALLSGSHRNSLHMVAEGRADIAAIDAVCWAFAQEYDPQAAGQLRVLGHSPTAPGLPLITALSTPPETLAALRAAFTAAIAAPELADARKALHLSSFHVLPASAYDRIFELKAVALKRPFPPLESSQG